MTTYTDSRVYTETQAPQSTTAAAAVPSLTPLSPTTTHQAPSSSVGTQSVVLSAEQEAVLQRVKQGQSIFFTGSAGKSTFVRPPRN